MRSCVSAMRNVRVFIFSVRGGRTLSRALNSAGLMAHSLTSLPFLVRSRGRAIVVSPSGCLGPIYDDNQRISAFKSGSGFSETKSFARILYSTPGLICGRASKTSS